jgi:hypothetical protein
VRDKKLNRKDLEDLEGFGELYACALASPAVMAEEAKP